MLKTRVIPILLWDGEQAVQTTQFKRPARPVGSMMQHIEVLERRNLDELIILDIEATIQGREPLYKDIQEFTSKIFCPLTVGGGIYKLKHIEKLLNAGADKVVIRSNSARKDFIRAAVLKFGAQAITIDIASMWLTPQACHSIAAYLNEIGVGEVMVTSIEKNGLMKGYELSNIKLFSESLVMPVIANGGCARPSDMRDALIAGAHAVAASSMFLFTEYTPDKCKKYLQEQGYPVRL